MFIGEYSHNIDEKGRLAIPVKFRTDLLKGAVVTKGLDNCLFLYTMDAWQERAEKWSKLPVNQKNSRAFARHMLAGAMDVSTDKQGRIMLPEYLRKYAGISKNVVVAGLYDRIELWDSETWKKYKEDTEKDSEDIAETLGEMGA